MVPNAITFAIIGPPRAKARPRLSGKAIYTPTATRRAEQEIGLTALAAGAKNLRGPLAVDMVAEFQVPRSITKAKRAARLSNMAAHSAKPDIDNLAKTVLDGLNGVAFADDAQVAELHASKIWTEGPSRTVITIREMS